MKSKHMTLSVMVVLMVTVLFNNGLFAGEEAKGGNFAKMFLPTWENAGKYSLEVAKLMPEEHYKFKPTPEVMTFAEQTVHTAGVIIFFSSKIKGVEPPKERPKASEMSKADIVKLMEKAFAMGKKAIANLGNEEAHKKIHVFGDINLMKVQVVLLMRDHTTHHRGQMIPYLRLKGLKPPRYSGF